MPIESIWIIQPKDDPISHSTSAIVTGLSTKYVCLTKSLHAVQGVPPRALAPLFKMPRKTPHRPAFVFRRSLSHASRRSCCNILNRHHDVFITPTVVHVETNRSCCRTASSNHHTPPLRHCKHVISTASASPPCALSRYYHAQRKQLSARRSSRRRRPPLSSAPRHQSTTRHLHTTMHSHPPRPATVAWLLVPSFSPVEMMLSTLTALFDDAFRSPPGRVAQHS
jgi:hypothetical protein